MRVSACWNFLSGACGYTYGNNAVWQMARPGQAIAIPSLYDWRDSLERPGAEQMQFIRALFETYSLGKILPDQSLVYGPNPEGPDHVRAAGASDRSFALLYLPQGKPVDVVLGKVAGDRVQVRWYEPRTGTYTTGRVATNHDIGHFIPPASGPERDWVLILEPFPSP